MFLTFTNPDGNAIYHIDPLKVGAVMPYAPDEECATIAVSGALITVHGTPGEVLERINSAIERML